MSLCRINIYARIRRDIMSTDRGSEYVIYLFIVAPVSGWETLGSRWAFCPQSWCVRNRKRGKCEDLSDLTKLWWIDGSERRKPAAPVGWEEWSTEGTSGEPVTRSWVSEDPQRRSQCVGLHSCGPTVGGALVWWLTFSFTSRDWSGACAPLTWGTRRHYGKEARQCQGMFVLWNLGSCHPYGSFFGTYHQLSFVADHVHAVMVTAHPDGCSLLQQFNAPQSKDGSAAVLGKLLENRN